MLAALTFSDPLMLAGLVAAVIPVLLHLLNRIHAPVVPFPTLRFLKITAQKTARRRQVQQYFLLLIRVIVFALIAMAVAAPLIRGGAPSLAYGLVVILLAALVLLVLAAVWTSAALDRARAKPAANAPRETPSPAPFAFLSAFTFLLAIGLAALSVYGLMSDRFFSAARGEFNGRSTALVILLDNSHSMLANDDGRTRLDRAKETVRALLNTSLRPAEAAILPTNPGDAPAPSTLTSDTTRLLGSLESFTPTGRAQPTRERIRTALELLQSSGQPTKMLLVLSDFARPAFADADVFAALKSADPALRKDLQVILMPVGKNLADVGIASFALADSSERPAVGAQLTFEAALINNSDAADVRDFTFTVDGQPIDGMTSRVQLGAAGTPAARTTLKIPFRLAQHGAHRFGLRLDNAQDALAWNDQRELVLDVADQIKVLVIGPDDDRLRPRSAAFYLNAALFPFGPAPATTRPNSAPVIPWSIQPTYRGVNQLRDRAALNGFSAVFACDLPTIPPALADALVTFIHNDGRLVWILGPSVNAASYNDTLLANRNLLPAPLAQPLVTATAAPLEWVDIHSGIFANLFDTQDPFHATGVVGRWAFADDLPQNARTLARLGDNIPLLIEHAPPAAGDASGKIYTLLTTPAAAWSNLGSTVLLVPLASRMAMGAGAAGEGRAPSSFETGQQIPLTLSAQDAATSPPSIDVTTPENTVINIRPHAPAQSLPATAPALALAPRPQWFFDHAQSPGLYHWRTSDGHATGQFLVNPPADEADLLPADTDSLARESSPDLLTSGRETLVAASAADLLAQLKTKSEGTSLIPGFLAMVLILALVEALMSNRYRPGMK